MADKSAIEWTGVFGAPGATWNVVDGCDKVSPGCAHCYIDRTPPLRMAGRKFVNGSIPLVFHPERLSRPLEWTRPRGIFVNSLSDFFHEGIGDEVRGQMFDVMVRAHWHVFMILTKRETAMRDWCRGIGYYPNGGHGQQRIPGLPPHVWLGVTAENGRFLRQRGSALLECEAPVRWLSLEPLLGDVEPELEALLSLANGRIGWVVAGLESGPRRRPMQVTEWEREWIRSVQRVCASYDVPFLFKQWGGLTAKSGGRLLDGRIWDEYPRVIPLTPSATR